jgi:hypothetical protein
VKIWHLLCYCNMLFWVLGCMGFCHVAGVVAFNRPVDEKLARELREYR